MANVKLWQGLRPLARNQGGGAPETRTYTKAAAYGFAIFKWDPVTMLAGVLNGPASGITPGTTRYLGVALNWSPASVLSLHSVLTDPGAIFEGQGDGSTGANVVAAKMGYDANLLLTTAGGAVTRDNSGAQIDESTIAVTSTFDIKILQLCTEPDNAYGASARLEIRFNKHLRNAEVTVT